MDNKIQNIVLKSLTGLIIFLGTLFTIWVLMSGDPGQMSKEEMDQLAIKEAKVQGLEKTKSQLELDDWIRERGKEIKTEMEKTTYSNVSTIIDFTKYILFFAIFLVVAAFGYLFTIDARKAAINLAGIMGVVIFLYIIYAASGNEVPVEYIAKEKLKGIEEADRVFTAGNWQLASAALTSTVILFSIAALGWIGGTVMKIFK